MAITSEVYAVFKGDPMTGGGRARLIRRRRTGSPARPSAPLSGRPRLQPDFAVDTRAAILAPNRRFPWPGPVQEKP
jgi:hypothetical protein